MIWAGPVIATPFLICDPQAGVTEYQLTIDGTDKGMFPAETDGSAKIELSQFNLPDGEHTFILVASSAWGASGPSDPCVNIKVIPIKPTSLDLSE